MGESLDTWQFIAKSISENWNNILFNFVTFAIILYNYSTICVVQFEFAAINIQYLLFRLQWKHLNSQLATFLSKQTLIHWFRHPMAKMIITFEFWIIGMKYFSLNENRCKNFSKKERSFFYFCCQLCDLIFFGDYTFSIFPLRVSSIFSMHTTIRKTVGW